MNKSVQFADVLNRYVGRSGYSPSQLARLSGIPKTTLITWLHRRVKKPDEWRDLVRLAAVLHLDEAEATTLLQAAGQPSLGELLIQTGETSERDLLSPWTEAVRLALEIAPFQAIADLPYFVGRERELEDLKEALVYTFNWGPSPERSEKPWRCLPESGAFDELDKKRSSWPRLPMCWGICHWLSPSI
jgi:transcriptional regulator with XRE-family HTH domain